MVNFHVGNNIPEYPFISALTERHTHSLDVCLFKETTGQNIWQQLYKYPEYGVSLFASSLGNDKVLGREVAMTYFIKLYFLSQQRFRMFNRIGIGGSYVTRKFDLQDNYTNVAVGSHLNIHFNYRLGMNYAIADRSRFNAGLSFDHLSNGNTSEPNLGLNYLSAYTGVSYRLGEKSEKQVQEIDRDFQRNELSLFASIGGKHARALSSSYFPTASLSLEYDRIISPRLHLGAGADVFYDSSVESSFHRDYRSFQSWYSWSTGLHLSQTVVFNRVSLSLQEGLYLILGENVDHYKIYNRGILQYRMGKHLSLRLAMKAHLYILDYPEIGLGYKF